MSGTTTPTPLQTYMLGLINDARAAADLRPLVLDAELIAAAAGHSRWMAEQDTLSHTGAGGSSASGRVTAAGFDWRSVGENVAYVAGTRVALNETVVRQLHTNLMNSAPHRGNLMSTAFTHIGIGFATGDLRGLPSAWVTQNFGVPTPAELADGTGIAEVAPRPPPAPTTPATPPAPQPVTPTPVPAPTPTPALTPGPVRVTFTAGATTRTVEARWNGTGYDVADVPAA